MSTTGIPASEMRARHFEHLMLAPMRVSCALCSWKAEGEAGDLLKRQKRHRERRHGIVDWHFKRSSVRNLTSFRQVYLTEVDKAEIETDIARRRRLHGLEDVAA